MLEQLRQKTGYGMNANRLLILLQDREPTLPASPEDTGKWGREVVCTGTMVSQLQTHFNFKLNIQHYLLHHSNKKLHHSFNIFRA